MTSRIELVLGALRTGPKSNAELQDVLDTHSADVARIMAKLRRRGLIERQITSNRAIYRLREPT
jgi:DNA-binding MarR family transcriptional regulator